MTIEEQKEHRREVVRRSRVKHRDKRRIIENRWRDKNKERVKETSRLWSSQNRARINEKQRIRRAINPEKRKQLDRIRYRNPKSRRTSGTRRYLQLYGLTREDLNKLQIASCGRCDLCGQQDENTRRTDLHIDHNHTTGKVRGLLCYRCNVKTGQFESLVLNNDWIVQVKKYLTNYP